MIVAFYGFQAVPRVMMVDRLKGWGGWFEERALPVIDMGYRDLHLHNPFGLHVVPGRKRVMWIDQFQRSSCQGYRWLADRHAFADAVEKVHLRGGTVQAYVGSPLVVRQPPQEEFLPKCLPGSETLAAQLRALGPAADCGGPLSSGCSCWGRLIAYHIQPLLDADVDAIGFDASFDFSPGDCMDLLVRWLVGRGKEVIIEPWPRANREYPRVTWIIREKLYQRITLNPKPVEAPLAAVRGKIYRIVPAETEEGDIEFAEINTIRSNYGATPFNDRQEIVDAIRAAGHIPQIRDHQLAQGKIT